MLAPESAIPARGSNGSATIDAAPAIASSASTAAGAARSDAPVAVGDEGRAGRATGPSRWRTISKRVLFAVLLLGLLTLGLFAGYEFGRNGSTDARARSEPATSRPAAAIAPVPSSATSAVVPSAAATRKSEPRRSRTGVHSQARPREKPAKPSSARGASGHARTKAKTKARQGAGPGTRTVTTSQRAPVLTWRPVSGASFYAVRLFRGDVRILDLWPSTTHVRVPASWVYGGADFKLRPGRYRWYVYPGIGNPSRLRLGKLAEAGALVVGAGSG